jgi:hypothetical protein
MIQHYRHLTICNNTQRGRGRDDYGGNTFWEPPCVSLTEARYAPSKVLESRAVWHRPQLAKFEPRRGEHVAPAKASRAPGAQRSVWADPDKGEVPQLQQVWYTTRSNIFPFLSISLLGSPMFSLFLPTIPYVSLCALCHSLPHCCWMCPAMPRLN